METFGNITNLCFLDSRISFQFVLVDHECVVSVSTAENVHLLPAHPRNIPAEPNYSGGGSMSYTFFLRLRRSRRKNTF